MQFRAFPFPRRDGHDRFSRDVRDNFSRDGHDQFHPDGQDKSDAVDTTGSIMGTTSPTAMGTKGSVAMGMACMFVDVGTNCVICSFDCLGIGDFRGSLGVTFALFWLLSAAVRPIALEPSLC